MSAKVSLGHYDFGLKQNKSCFDKCVQNYKREGSRLNCFSFRPPRRSNCAQTPPVNAIPWGRDIVSHSYKTMDKLKPKPNQSTGRCKCKTNHCVHLQATE
jgi:hypothetical protein